MRLTIVDATRKAPRPKATIHKTGNLGFNNDAADVLRLGSAVKAFRVAINADEDDGNLYLVPSSPDEDKAVHVSKAGEYYYLNLKDFFSRRNEDFANQKIMYDIKKLDYNGKLVFALKRRVKAR